jgi:TolB-like protein/Tfp pilus assembly protein PilF
LAGPDIFLSYNREDADMARSFAEGFRTLGLDVWWDQALHSGEAYDKVTEQALRGAKAVVVLWSPRSVESRWVRAEATIADRNHTLIPALIEACELPVMFELTQTADLTHWRGEAQDRAWLAFLGDVRRMVGRPSDRVETEPAAAPPLTSAASGAPSVVAVLPCTHRSDDKEMAVLAEELTEEITRELATNGYLQVIAAGAMAPWRGKSINHRALGQELDARYLVEAKVQQSGADVRLTLELIDPVKGRMLWSHRLAGKCDEVVVALEKFGLDAAAALGRRIMQIEVTRAMSKEGPLSAWDHMLRSMAYVGRGGIEYVSMCIEESRQAVDAAPHLGLAHSNLALALGALVISGISELDDKLSHEIRTHITRAIQLDGEDPSVMGGLGVAYTALGDGEAALRFARRALELNSSSPRAYDLVGIALLELGRTVDAIAAFTRDERPNSYFGVRHAMLASLAICYLLEGQPDQADEVLDQSLAHFADYGVALKWKAIAAAQRGNEQVALVSIKRLREVEPQMSIDQHIRQIIRSPYLAERTGEHVATLRRLWEATDGEPNYA